MRKKKRQISMPSDEQVREERKREAYRSRFRKTLLGTVSVLLVVAAIAVLISTLLLPVIQVAGNSMEPTLYDGDILVLIRTGKYNRGDVCCISWQNKKLLKRVIGLPGDYITIDEEGNVFVNDVLLDEPYVSDKDYGECDIDFPYQVPDGKYFVLGDHRLTSIDSRSSMIGCIEREQMIGRVLFKAWPLFKKENR